MLIISGYLLSDMYAKVPLVFWFDQFQRLEGKNPSKNLVHFFGDLKTPKFPSEIKWSLGLIAIACMVSLHKGSTISSTVI